MTTDGLREHLQKYIKLLTAGYFNPIPTIWANSIRSPLNQLPVFNSFASYDDAAEERMYWV